MRDVKAPEFAVNGVVVAGEHLLLVEADVEAFQRSKGRYLGRQRPKIDVLRLV